MTEESLETFCAEMQSRRRAELVRLLAESGLDGVKAEAVCAAIFRGVTDRDMNPFLEINQGRLGRIAVCVHSFLRGW